MAVLAPTFAHTWAMLAVAFALLGLTGGVASFYTLWLFLLFPVAAMTLSGSQVIAFLAIGSAAYIALNTVLSTGLPIAVLLGRSMVLFGTGVIVGYVNWLREKDRKSIRALLASRDRFLSSVAHGLRTPLTTVLGFSELLIESADYTGEDATELTARIRDEAARLTLLIEDLTVAERSGEGLLAFDATTFRALDAVREVIGDPMLAERAPTIEIGGGDATVRADRERLHQLLRHLVENALDHGGGRIRVDVGTEREFTTISVSDDGPGAPDAYVAMPDAPFGVDPTEPVGLRDLGLYCGPCAGRSHEWQDPVRANRRVDHLHRRVTRQLRRPGTGVSPPARAPGRSGRHGLSPARCGRRG